MPKVPTPEEFLKDVAAHEMTVLQNEGVYRHLRFANAKQNAWNQWFEIVTWPNKLAVSGDMGTWVFKRLHDMFNFFRSKDGELKINPDYWGEKVESESRAEGPHKKFRSGNFKAALIDTLNAIDTLNEDAPSETQKQKIITALSYDIFHIDNAPEARRALLEFEYEDFKFPDPIGLVEAVSNSYSSHYIWCLYAIVWGIQQFDARSAAPILDKNAWRGCMK